MLKYLVCAKGYSRFFPLTGWRNSLSSAKKIILRGLCRGFSSDDLVVLESKSPFSNVYRFKKFVDGKWINSFWIDLTDFIYSEIIYKYADSHLDDLMKYRAQMLRDFGESVSIIDWAFRNDCSVREIILWMYFNGYFSDTMTEV